MYIQGELLFDLPYYPQPNTDNQRLMNLQHRYVCTGDKKALHDLYMLGKEVALKMIHKAAVKNRHIKQLSADSKDEKAHNASVYLIEQFISRRTFFVRTSYTGYLYKRVQYELFYYRKIDKKILYCDDTQLPMLS